MSKKVKSSASEIPFKIKRIMKKAPIACDVSRQVIKPFPFPLILFRPSLPGGIVRYGQTIKFFLKNKKIL